MRRSFLAEALSTSWPRVTWPSPAMTTLPSRRTQITVVERMRCFIGYDYFIRRTNRRSLRVGSGRNQAFRLSCTTNGLPLLGHVFVYPIQVALHDVEQEFRFARSVRRARIDHHFRGHSPALECIVQLV